MNTVPIQHVAEKLCLRCGLCCDGTLFKDVELQAGDDRARLAGLGLPIQTRRGVARFAQPCAALDGCRCRLYVERPTRCRDFECALFKSAAAGGTTTTAAWRLIRTARHRAERVRELLGELGDTGEDAALSVRFRRLSRRFQNHPPGAGAARRFSELTVAMHELNLLLGREFFP